MLLPEANVGKYMNISFFFTFSPQDGMVQFGKAKVSPQFQVGPVAHPSVVTGLPVRDETVSGFLANSAIKSFLPTPTPTRFRFPTIIPDASPVPVVWVLDWYRQAGSHFLFVSDI